MEKGETSYDFLEMGIVVQARMYADLSLAKEVVDRTDAI
jgi:hypothetical protein